jgi:transcriptional regulator with XRE-family HTH domain
MNTETYGDWLDRQRRRRKLTQQQLGDAVGLKPSYISKIKNGHIKLPDEDTRARIHQALGTTEDDLVAVGILERIESIEPGGEPVYIAAEHITPGERMAESAHRAFEGRPSPPPTTDDPRATLMALLAGASDDDIRKVVQIVTILLGAVEANREESGQVSRMAAGS